MCFSLSLFADADADEIEIVNQNDYEIFMSKCTQNMHMQIATISAEKEDAKPEPGTGTAHDSSPEKEASNFIIHDGVQCDACEAHPIVGFRYKCVQCPNFDLCQGCEALHKHPDHLMVRMPTNNGPSIIDAWLSGPGSSGSHHHRRSGRRFRSGQCPFAEATAASTQTTPTTGASPAAAAAADSHKESRRERRHARRHGQGVLSQFVEMMMHLPEADAAPTAAAAAAVAAEAAEAAAAAATEAAEAAAAATAPTAPEEESHKKAETRAQNTETPKVPVTERVTTTGNAEEPVAAPRTKEQSSAAPTPTTPVISLENLAQMVNPQYMRAGIEILNNFSEMFAKMIDPNEGASFGTVGNSMTSNASSTGSSKPETATEAPQKPETATVAPQKLETKPETVESQPESVKSSMSGNQTPPVVVPVAEPEERRRSESLDQDWQMIDNTASPIANVSSSDALINLNGASPVDSAAAPEAAAVPPSTFGQLSEMLRQHVNEEQQREQSSTTAHTQTSQVDTVSTSTSTTPVATNSTSTSTTTARPAAPEDKRAVPIYHTSKYEINVLYSYVLIQSIPLQMNRSILLYTLWWPWDSATRGLG